MHKPMRPSSMKHSLLLLFCVFSFFPGSVSSNPRAENNSDNNRHPTGNKMRIKIGTNTFPATLYEMPQQPHSSHCCRWPSIMVELNGNEKYFDLSGNLPTNASNLRMIQSGDLMIYGSNTLVLFYKTFSTSYIYTRLGRIDDTERLAAAVGSRNVMVMYELE